MNSKKVISLALVFLLLTPILVSASDNNISVYLNDYLLPLNHAAFKQGNDVYLPAKDVLTNCGMVVTWDNYTQLVTAQSSFYTLTLKDNSYISWLNGQSIITSKPVKIIKGVTYIPSELLTKCFNYGVNVSGNAVNIYTTFQIVSIIPDGVLDEKNLSNVDRTKLNNIVTQLETKYNRTLIKETYIDHAVITDFVNYLNTPPSLDMITQGKFDWDNYLGYTVSNDTINKFSKWKVIAPLSDIRVSFKPVVFYSITDTEYLVGGYFDYSGSETNITNAYNNYVNSVKRLFGYTLNTKNQKLAKEQIQSILSTLITDNSLKLFIIKNGLITDIK